MKNNTRKPLNIFALFLPEIKELLERKDFVGIKNLMRTINSMDLAEGWRNLEPNSRSLSSNCWVPKIRRAFRESSFRRTNLYHRQPEQPGGRPDHQ
jgi:hypothetical protein